MIKYAILSKVLIGVVQMAYKQLTFQKRCKIYVFWEAGLNQSQIAEKIGVHKSTISHLLGLSWDIGHIKHIIVDQEKLLIMRHQESYLDKKRKVKQKMICYLFAI